MGVSIGMVVIGFCVWYFFLREAPTEAASPIAEKTMQDNVVDDEAGFETIRDSGILDDQLNLLRRLDEWPREAETPVRLDTLSKRLELAKVVQDTPNLDPETRISNARRILNAIGQIYGIALLEGIDSDGKIVSDYLNICNSFVIDSDPGVAREARLAKAKVLVFESTDGDFETKFETIEENLLDLIELYPNDDLVASTIKSLALQLESRDKELSRGLLKKIVNRYEQKSVTSVGVVNQLKNIKDEMVLEESGIVELAREAIATDSYDRYLEKLYELAELPNTGVELINRISKAVGFFESKGKHDIALAILEKLSGTVFGRQDPAVKEHAFRVSHFGTIRNNAVGKPFDFSDLTADGETVDLVQFSDRPVLIVFYSPNNPNSAQLLKNINGTYGLISRTGVRIVAVAVDKSKKNDEPIKLNRNWVDIQNSPPPGRTSEIFKRCPVTSVPYVSVVNHDGGLEMINVPVNNIKTVIENMAVARQSEQ